MPSNNKALILATFALGGCSSDWWRDPPASAAPAAATAPIAAGGLQPAYPEPADPPPGSAYPVDPVQTPSRQPPSGFDAPPPSQAVRYDNVGYAVWSNEAGTVSGAHATLPPGTFVEVTALDTGKTVLVPITTRSGGEREIELSGAAAQELGLARGGSGAVRVRVANPTGADLAALRLGRPAPARPDTPPVLLNALKRKLAGTLGQSGGQAGSPPPRRSTPPMSQRLPTGYVPSVPARGQPSPPPATRAPVAGPGYYVQIAAMADPARAATVARQVGGAVTTAGGYHRVRLGPFHTLRTAQAARDDVATRGYADARIVRED